MSAHELLRMRSASNLSRPCLGLRHAARRTPLPILAVNHSPLRTQCTVQSPQSPCITSRTQKILPHHITSSLSIRTSSARTFSSSSCNMADQLDKQILKEGDGKTYPKQGQTVVMEYTGWLHDPSAPENRGKQFDSSKGRGDFETAIGVGRVIQGWDEGVPTMSKGERAVLTIPGRMAYGDRGFPGLIPKNATLIFEVELKNIK